MKKIENIEEFLGLPVYADDGKGNLPEEECIILSKTGWSQLSISDDYVALIPLSAPPRKLANETKHGITWKGPKIPAADLDLLCNIMWRFYEKKHCELGIHLMHSETDGFWYFIPRQVVSGASTDWDADLGGVWLKNGRFTDAQPSKNIRRIGTLHSHHVMPPNWSDKDIKQQKTCEYGIQLVVGGMGDGRAIRSRIALFGHIVDVPLFFFNDTATTEIPVVPDWLTAPLPKAAPKEKTGKAPARAELDALKRKGIILPSTLTSDDMETLESPREDGWQ